MRVYSFCTNPQEWVVLIKGASSSKDFSRYKKDGNLQPASSYS
ncbi:hypothetical protein T4B_4143 [Trichinella pseudospiralis]|uniref:Uncharacterized protein n=1 Tax=Trichinella pseudospiralis TaxID=6337 RepID=A0A0V1GJL0_TRIPS|nr:hypothetical protein T4B_1675 [Trichinella pseudospiralis]KRY98450.1 hypothetical protein T4B_2738 [Trichinella pseudospiralis]KRY98452.1 hypothetical protein T4B_4143 [Trichinella pseudospiralis]